MTVNRFFSLIFSLALPALLLSASALAASPPTLERIRDYNFPESLVAATQADRVAWIGDYHGRRNVWVAQAPDYAPRQLTGYTEDDGQELSSLSISGDGSRIVYVRGGEHGGNWDGGLPANPDSSPLPTRVEVWSLPFAGGKPALLGEGDDPVISPDARQVVFLKDKQAWIVPADGTREARRLFTARGETHSLAWSPDGRLLAFVSDRDSHSLVGIYRDDATPLQWLAPSGDRDDAPRWSPDGSRVLFVRRPGAGGPPPPRLEYTPRPWSIWVAEVASGKAERKWSSGNGQRDSYFWDPVEWTADGGIVFHSYSDGWKHLYALPPGGGAPLLLTPGAFQVEEASLAPDRRSLLYAANAGPDRDDSERRHVFRVPVDRATPQLLTPGTGSEWSPAQTGGGQLLFFSATAQRPPVPALLDRDGHPKLLAQPSPDYPSASLVVPRHVSFKAADGIVVHGQLFEPKAGGKHPAVVYVHGGPQRQMLLNWHYMGYYSNDYAVNQYLASQGYVVLSINYRLGPNYGFDFHFPAEAGARGGAEYRDVQAGGHWLQTLDNVDPQRIGIYGGSYGGYLTAMALAHDSDLFKAGVDVHGVHDWVADEYDGLFVRDRYEVPADAERSLDVAWQASPVSAVAQWKSPVLFIHGDDDRNVKVEQTIDLVQRLRGIGMEPETLILVDETHSLQRYANVLRMNAAVVEFLHRHLEP